VQQGMSSKGNGVSRERVLEGMSSRGNEFSRK